MRSSGRTIVSRTRARIPSERRSLRGLCVRAFSTAVSLFGISVFVVIVCFSVEVVAPGALRRTELAATEGAVEVVGAEGAGADRTPLQVRHCFSVSTRHTHP